MSLHTINWIMGCLTYVFFTMLINGSPFVFFSLSRGLRKGFSLSPFHLFLVAKGPSMVKKYAKRKGKMKGLQVASFATISHLLFMDDIMLFGHGFVKELEKLKELLDLYCKVACMEINMNKSLMSFNNLIDDIKAQAKIIFPMKTCVLDQGVKYLGFFLKPNDYEYEDWTWLYNKVEAKFSMWCNTWLSHEGRLVLVKAVSEIILVYWITIVKIPKAFPIKLERNVLVFFGLRRGQKKEFHWSRGIEWPCLRN
jgi:hypothetical protein